MLNAISFDKFTCSGNAIYAGDGNLEIKGKLKIPEKKSKIQFWAGCPPDHIQSYSGSGLPFPNPDVAYENTPNIGTVYSNDNGDFSFKIRIPNSYYNGLGTIYQSPHVQIKVINSESQHIHSIDVSNGIPFRLLTYPGSVPRTSPLFYDYRHIQPIRTQEQILIDSGYPKINKTPDNFWGLSVPHT